jgi:alkylation response protein AidB-like acyl-CoA dehydrogenase
MNFGFTEEQDLLRQQLRKWLDERCPLAEVRRIAETPEGFSRELWKQLGELGFIGLAIPVAFGGAGLRWLDVAIALEETGRTLFPSPLLSTLLAASLVLDAGDEAQRRRWLPGLADGSRIAAPALLDAGDVFAPHGVRLRARRDAGDWVVEGEKAFVPDADAAELLIVALRTGDGERDLTLAAVERDAAGLSVAPRDPIDPTRRLAALHFGGVRLPQRALLGAPGSAWPAIARALDRGAAGASAEMLGAAEGALALTVRFARQRVQFGSPIGRFQGVKHPLAERYAEIESAKSLLYFAAWALDAAPAEVPRAVSEAKALASLALSRMGIDGIQLHGAIGYTAECDIQLYLRRSKWARPLFGDETLHFDRIAELGGW